MIRSLFVLASTVACLSAAAQTQAQFAGTWAVKWQTNSGRLEESELVITDNSGSWRTAHHVKKDPCVGQKAPVVFDEIIGSEAKITLKFSEVLQGCTDARIRINKIDDNTMTGTRGKSVLSLERK